MQRFQKIFQSEATGGILLFIFALMAIILANTALSESYFNFLDTPVSV
jgi:Na(+)/H(+) antiporter nhaA